MVEKTRTLDFKIAFAIGLGTMIAAGIFSLSGTAVAAIGSSAVVAFVIAALIAGVTAATYSEFASVYSENGGGYLFSSETFEHDRLVFTVGAMLFLGYTGTTAFYLATMDEWFVRFVIPPSIPIPHGVMGVLVAVLLGALNARGTEESGTFQLLITSAKVMVLLAFIGGMFYAVGPTEATTAFTGGFRGDPVGILTISALAFITFFGFSAIAASAGEIIEPRKTVPRAIAASMVTVTVLYALVIIAMVNSSVPASVVAEQGETAMGLVAEGFLGQVGQYLIVAGAIFSMVSASNASILAASSIGSLMGRNGQAPRRFARIHREFRTPFWSITSATGLIVALILVFISVFPSEGGLTGLNLGLTALTGFATLNLLLPLAIVNVALIYSRRRSPDLERGFRVPGVPLVPIVGVLANLGLIYNLPRDGVAVGLVLTSAVVLGYLAWGGAPAVEELFHEVPTAGAATPGGADEERRAVESGPQPTTPTEQVSEATAATEEGAEQFRMLVPVARPKNAVPYVRLAALLGTVTGRKPVVQVHNVTQTPDQTPYEIVVDTAEKRVARIQELLNQADIDVEYTVTGHISRDIAFDILQTARDGDADRILMGYPETNPTVAERIEYGAPCEVMFANGFSATTDLSVVMVGAGGGPHHEALLPLVDQLGRGGAELHVVSVTPPGGTEERPEETLGQLSETPSVQLHNVTGTTIPEGLVSTAAEHDGVLMIGATRDRRLRQWVLGSTPDRVIDLADDAGVPVLVYASPTGVPGGIEDYLYPVYRYLRKFVSGPRRSQSSFDDDRPAHET